MDILCWFYKNNLFFFFANGKVYLSQKHILVNSAWWKRQLINQGIPEKKITILYNTLVIDHENFDKERYRQKLRSRYNIGSQTCVFLCVQGFRPGKRHLDLIHCFAKLPLSIDWFLWIVGEGVERKKCQAVVDRYGIEKRVRFIGQCLDPRPYYAGADVAISVSLEDSLPNFIIEAQSMQLPVIAIDTKGVNESFLSFNS